MKATLRILALSAALLTVFGCTPQDKLAEKISPEQIKQQFEKQYPDVKVKSVASTPIPEIYELVVGEAPQQEVVYTDATVAHLLVGNLIDTKSKESLTEKRLIELNKPDLKQFPLQNALKDVRGNGQRQLIVFSDPDCPFCKKLEADSLSKLDNVTIYTFLYPLAELHPDAPKKSRQIWCSKDPLKAWHDHMRNGKEVDAKASDSCKNPVDETIALGNKLNFTGTPTLIFANGEAVPGALPLAQIEQKLNQK